jgi:hypothetical protein
MGVGNVKKMRRKGASKKRRRSKGGRVHAKERRRST